MAAMPERVIIQNERATTRETTTSVKPKPVAVARVSIPASLRHDMIAEAAYFLAQARGFLPGNDLEDWLTAEREVDALLRERYA